MKTRPVFARSRALEISEEESVPLPDSIVWMPAGDHEVSAGTRNGGSWRGSVLADARAASRISESFDRVIAAGRKVWLDFDHEEGEAAAWVKGFSWDPARGIVASVEWTGAGERALREKLYYSFSPAFNIDPQSGMVASLLEGYSAGGLVNAPAFGAAMPDLIAANLPDEQAKPAEDTELAKQLAAANAQIATLTAELAAAKASQRIDEELRGVAVSTEARASLVKSFLSDESGTLALVASMKAAARQPAQVFVSPGVHVHALQQPDSYEAYMSKLKRIS